jgi:hypothetical protein
MMRSADAKADMFKGEHDDFDAHCAATCPTCATTSRCDFASRIGWMSLFRPFPQGLIYPE